MATSLAIIGLFGLLASVIFQRLKLPGLLGMLLLGVLVGPYGLNVLDQNLLTVSGEFRKMALIVILLRAGFGINRDDLNAIGFTAFKMSFLPGVCEGVAVMFLSQWLLGFTWIQGGMLGFILAAVSPAVIVPFMLKLQELGYGESKRIPTMILAAASVDDVVAITLFSAFLGFYMGNGGNIGLQLLGIPLSIILGILLGLVIGFVLVYLFKKYHIRDTKKIVMILGIAILLTALEQLVKDYVAMASLIGVMTIGFVIVEKRPVVAKRLAAKLNKVWVFAEILLFVLVGAQVNVTLAIEAGGVGLVLLTLGLMARSVGVWIATMGSGLNAKEKWFSTLAFLPKATVQAAIGAIPLSFGVQNGELILALAVLSIVVTAPLGAVALELSAKKLLVQTTPESSDLVNQ